MIALLLVQVAKWDDKGSFGKKVDEQVTGGDRISVNLTPRNFQNHTGKRFREPFLITCSMHDCGGTERAY